VLPLGKGALVFRLDVPSSPARIAAVAKLIDDMLKSIAPHLAEGEVTLVVDNFLSRSEVRPRSEEACHAVQLVLDFLDNPTKVAKKHPEARSLARVMKEHGSEFRSIGAEFFRARGRKALAVYDEEFIETMAAVAKAAMPPTAIRQGIQIFSPVLRVGRLHVTSKSDQARVVVHGNECEIQLAASLFGAAVKAASARELHPINILASYTRHGDFDTFDPKRSVITEIEPAIKPMTGSALLNILREHAPSLRERPLPHREDTES